MTEIYVFIPGGMVLQDQLYGVLLHKEEAYKEQIH